MMMKSRLVCRMAGNGLGFNKLLKSHLVMAFTAANMISGGGIPVFGGNGITGYHDQVNVTKPTLVIGRVAIIEIYSHNANVRMGDG